MPLMGLLIRRGDGTTTRVDLDDARAIEIESANGTLYQITVDDRPRLEICKINRPDAQLVVVPRMSNIVEIRIAKGA